MKKRYRLKNKNKFITFVSMVILTALIAVFTTNAYGYREVTYRLVEIKSGDTLWDIAKQYGKNQDIRRYIYDVVKLNNLASSEIYAGSILKVPVE